MPNTPDQGLNVLGGLQQLLVTAMKAPNSNVAFSKQPGASPLRSQVLAAAAPNNRPVGISLDLSNLFTNINLIGLSRSRDSFLQNLVTLPGSAISKLVSAPDPAQAL